MYLDRRGWICGASFDCDLWAHWATLRHFPDLHVLVKVSHSVLSRSRAVALPQCLTPSLKTHFVRPLGLNLWALPHYCTTGCLLNFLLPLIVTVLRINAEIIPWVDGHSALPSFPPFRVEAAQSCCSFFIKQHKTLASFPFPLP